MREIFVEFEKTESPVQNIRIPQKTGRCEECVKADVCRLIDSYQKILQQATDLSSKDFQIAIKCSHFA